MPLLRCLLLLLSVTLPLSAAIDSAEDLVTELYRQQTKDQGPFFQTNSQKLVDRYFAKPLAALIWKDAVTADGEVGALDFDPLYDSNDPDAQNLEISDRSADDDRDKTTVEATFEQHLQSFAACFQPLQGVDDRFFSMSLFHFRSPFSENPHT